MVMKEGATSRYFVGRAMINPPYEEDDVRLRWSLPVRGNARMKVEDGQSRNRARVLAGRLTEQLPSPLPERHAEATDEASPWWPLTRPASRNGPPCLILIRLPCSI
jgi:hypothetical protein